MRETKVKVKIARKEGDLIITGKVSTDFSIPAKAKRIYEEVIAESEMVRVSCKLNDGTVTMNRKFDYPMTTVHDNIGIIFSPKGNEDLCLNFKTIDGIQMSVGTDHFDYTIKFKLHNGEVTFSGVLA